MGLSLVLVVSRHADDHECPQSVQVTYKIVHKVDRLVEKSTESTSLLSRLSSLIVQ
jgi:hypothetical protein